MNQVPSQFFQKYKTIIGKEYVEEVMFDYQHIVTLQQLGLYHHSTPFTSQLKLTLLESSINSQIMIYQAVWGKITIKITIINESFESKFHTSRKEERFLSQGRYSNIYEGFIGKKKIVIKCTRFDQENQQKKILTGIKQCFLMKIGSILEFGPKFMDELGFDMIIFNNCFEILMEKCLQPLDTSLREKKNELHILKKGLHLMHRLSIFHFDIKPENIMFSPTFKKHVLIDFNLSDMREAEFGFKTLSRFRGTLNFCSEEMSSLFSV